MADVKIEGVRKSFGAAEVIHGVDVDIEEGEFVVLVGPSGCGKSTLLRMIAGLEDISSGTVSIGGRVVNDLPPKTRDIAMVFQNYALYPHKTVAKNMGFSLHLAREKPEVINRKVREAAKILGLENLLERYPKQLSGGQRQRVAMGRAIVRDPSVFLFDEPLSNLDAKLRVQMRTEIKELHQRLQTTIIYVTHDQIEAMTMADKIVVMRDGVVEQMGRPLDLYDAPANLFVAGFIGSPGMNFIHGRLSGGETPAFETSDGTRLPLPASLCVEKRGPAILGVRPEHLVLAADGEGFEARVALVEPTGAETMVNFRAFGADMTAAFRERHDFHSGDVAHLAFDPRQIHLFNGGGSSGERVAFKKN
ncbi:MAG TPA: sn-glycerol-3-phosphate ABC transporter ATP-binding protein UgpC [Pararhizobium sp.]|nr:sn-glycerol-3-phosphate ABC transporter ATP-binding protein UgpC [Pararhizobium sp.]